MLLLQSIGALWYLPRLLRQFSIILAATTHLRYGSLAIPLRRHRHFNLVSYSTMLLQVGFSFGLMLCQHLHSLLAPSMPALCHRPLPFQVLDSWPSVEAAHL